MKVFNYFVVISHHSDVVKGEIRSNQAVGVRPPRNAPAPLLPCECRSRADGNVAAVSHGQHVPTPTAAAA